MLEICFATNNAHKLAEVQAILKDKLIIRSLKDIGCTEDIPETADTIEGNSLLKAQYIVERYGIACFADDSGLEVDALQGAPGVYSARFAGPQKNDADNVKLLLEKLEHHTNRKAQFKTVITLIIKGQTHQFTGTIAGHIAPSPKGQQGFGYDPVFIPEGHSRTFAEFSAAEKNAISHRARATAQLIDFLTSMNGL